MQLRLKVLVVVLAVLCLAGAQAKPDDARLQFDLQSMRSQLSSANDFAASLQRDNAWLQKQLAEAKAKCEESK